MVYALTLPTEPAGESESNVVVVELEGECSGPVVEPEPAPVIEPAPELAPAPTPEPSAGPHAFAFLAGNGNYVVFATDVDASWGTGRFFEPDGDAEQRVGKRADLDRVDAEHRAQIGRTFDLYDRFGQHCSAKIDRLMVIAQYGWGIEGLELELYDRETNEAIEHSPEVIQEAVWATQERWLVGVLDDDECDGVWARDAALPAPTILTYTRESSPTLAARIAHFEREELPPLREDYEAFRAEHEGPDYEDYEFETWDVRMADQAPDVGAWIDTAGVARFVTLDYGFDDSVCGFGHASEIQSFDAVEDGTFQWVDSRIDVAAVFDVDLDGNFELLHIDPAEDAPQEVWSVNLASETDGLSSGLAVYQDHSGCTC
jgi:hypothetical protein